MSTVAILPDGSILVRTSSQVLRFDRPRREIVVRRAMLGQEHGGTVLATYPASAAQRIRLVRADDGVRLELDLVTDRCLDLGTCPTHDTAMRVAWEVADLTQAEVWVEETEASPLAVETHEEPTTPIPYPAADPRRAPGRRGGGDGSRGERRRRPEPTRAPVALLPPSAGPGHTVAALAAQDLRTAIVFSEGPAAGRGGQPGRVVGRRPVPPAQHAVETAVISARDPARDPARDAAPPRRRPAAEPIDPTARPTVILTPVPSAAGRGADPSTDLDLPRADAPTRLLDAEAPAGIGWAPDTRVEPARAPDGRERRAPARPAPSGDSDDEPSARRRPA